MCGNEIVPGSLSPPDPRFWGFLSEFNVINLHISIFSIHISTSQFGWHFTFYMEKVNRLYELLLIILIDIWPCICRTTVNTDDDPCPHLLQFPKRYFPLSPPCLLYLCRVSQFPWVLFPPFTPLVALVPAKPTWNKCYDYSLNWIYVTLTRNQEYLPIQN